MATTTIPPSSSSSSYTFDLVTQTVHRIIINVESHNVELLCSDVVLAMELLCCRTYHQQSIHITPYVTLIEVLCAQVKFEWLSRHATYLLTVFCRNYAFCACDQSADVLSEVSEALSMLLQTIESKWSMDSVWWWNLRMAWQCVEHAKHDFVSIRAAVRAVVLSSTSSSDVDELHNFVNLKSESVFVTMMKCHVYALEGRHRDLQDAIQESVDTKQSWEVIYNGVLCLVQCVLRVESVSVRNTLLFGGASGPNTLRSDVNLVSFVLFNKFWWYDNWRVREAALIGMFMVEKMPALDAEVQEMVKRTIGERDDIETDFRVLALLGCDDSSVWAPRIASFLSTGGVPSTFREVVTALETHSPPWMRANSVNYVQLCALDHDARNVNAHESIQKWIKEANSTRILMLQGVVGSGRTLLQLFSGFSMWLRYMRGDALPLYLDGRFCDSNMDYDALLLAVIHQNNLSIMCTPNDWFRLAHDFTIVLFVDNMDFELQPSLRAHILALVGEHSHVKVVFPCDITSSADGELAIPVGWCSDDVSASDCLQILPLSAQQLNWYIHQSLFLTDDESTSVYHTDMLSEMIGIDERLMSPFMLSMCFKVLPFLGGSRLANISSVQLLTEHLKLRCDQGVDYDMMTQICAHVASTMYAQQCHTVSKLVLETVIAQRAPRHTVVDVVNALPLVSNTMTSGEQRYAFEHAMFEAFFLCTGFVHAHTCDIVRSVVLEQKPLHHSDVLVRLLAVHCDDDSHVSNELWQLLKSECARAVGAHSSGNGHAQATSPLASLAGWFMNNLVTEDRKRGNTAKSRRRASIISTRCANIACIMAATRGGFNNVDMSQLSIQGADLRGTCMDSSTKLCDTDFSGVDLRDSILHQVDFSTCTTNGMLYGDVEAPVNCLSHDRLTAACLHEQWVVCGYARGNGAFVRIYDCGTGTPLHYYPVSDCEMVNGEISQICVGSSLSYILALVIQPRNRIVIMSGADGAMFMLSTGYDHDPNDVFYTVFTSPRYLAVVSGSTVYVHDLETHYIVQRKTFQNAWNRNNMLHYLSDKIFDVNTKHFEVSEEHFNAQMKCLDNSTVIGNPAMVIHAASKHSAVMAWEATSCCISVVSSAKDAQVSAIIDAKLWSSSSSLCVSVLFLSDTGDLLAIGNTDGTLQIHALLNLCKNGKTKHICTIQATPDNGLTDVQCVWRVDENNIDVCVASKNDIAVWTVSTKKKRMANTFPYALQWRRRRKFSMIDNCVGLELNNKD